jgi:hypothetical protein
MAYYQPATNRLPHAESFDPSIEVTMRDSLIIKAGKTISDRSDYAIMLGDGLAESLEIKVGDRTTLMAQTLDGSMNAIDTDVAAIVQTGVKEVDNITFYLPLQLAQKLMDTESLERIVIMLDETEGYESKRELLAAALNKELPSGLGVRSWFELCDIIPVFEKLFRRPKSSNRSDYFSYGDRPMTSADVSARVSINRTRTEGLSQ